MMLQKPLQISMARCVLLFHHLALCQSRHALLFLGPVSGSETGLLGLSLLWASIRAVSHPSAFHHETGNTETSDGSLAFYPFPRKAPFPFLYMCTPTPYPCSHGNTRVPMHSHGRSSTPTHIHMPPYTHWHVNTLPGSNDDSSSLTTLCICPTWGRGHRLHPSLQIIPHQVSDHGK